MKLAKLVRVLALASVLLGVARATDPAFRIYVSNERSGDVSVINSDSLAVVRVIAAGLRPRGIHVSRDGRTLLVATSGSPRMGPGADPDRAQNTKADKSADGIACIDLATNERTRLLKVGSDPEQFDQTNDGRWIVVANEDVAEASVWELEAGRLVSRAPVSGEPEGVTIHPQRLEAWVTCEETGDVFAMNPADGSIIAKMNVGGRPRTVAFSPDGKRAYVPLETGAAIAVVDAETHQVESPIALAPPALPMGSAVSADGRWLYVSTGRGNHVVVIDTATRAVAATIAVGVRPWGIALSPDGALLFSANGGSDDISVIDTRERREVRRIKVGKGPWGIAVGPAIDRGAPR